MRSGVKKDDGKPENEHVTLREIHRVAEANRLSLQQLELSVNSLTSICTALRSEMCSLGAISVQKEEPKADEVKPQSNRSSSQSLDLKDQMLGLKMQQLVDQAAALAIFKEAKTTPTRASVLAGNVKTIIIPTKEESKNVQATTPIQKSCTKLVIQSKESTTQNKVCSKLDAVNNMDATKPKGKSIPQSLEKSNKATPTARVSLRSTVQKTRTTISEVSVTNNSKQTSRSNISVKSLVRNVQTIQSKDSVKVKIQSNQGGATTIPEPELKPRRKWSTTTRINTLIK